MMMIYNDKKKERNPHTISYRFVLYTYKEEEKRKGPHLPPASHKPHNA
jgi:hypothetical protein